jgi:hypothetical protein
MVTISKCFKCGRERECDFVPVLINSTLPFCIKCQIEKETHLSELVESKANESQAELFISKAMSLDARIKISTDIFNAETVAIAEIKKVIDEDDTIANKHFRLAQAIETRYKAFAKVVHDKTDEILELETKQRALQTYFNTLGKELREHERAQLRLKDLQYKPKEPTKILKPKKEKLTVKTYDIAEIRAAAEKYSVMANMVQIFCIQRKITPDEAALLVRQTMDSVAKKES